VAAGEPVGFDALAENWKIGNEIAARNGRGMNPNQLRLVMPFYVAETRERARADVAKGLARWCEYFGRVAPKGMGDFGDGDPVDLFINSGRAVIGTPDDAIKMLERLQARQGEFGVILNQATNWADWENTKRSYELYARFVMPHFAQVNQNRRISFDRMRDEIASADAERAKGVELAFARWREAKGSSEPTD